MRRLTGLGAGLTLVLCVCTCAVLWWFFGGRGDGVEIAGVGVELWMGKQIPRLAAFAPDESTPVLKPQRHDPGSITFEQGTEGLIALANDQWVYINAYSTHDSGNLILAIASDGHLYACNGHVCPHLVICWEDQRIAAPLTLADFLSSTVFLFTGETGSSGWRMVDEWKAGPHRVVSFANAEGLLRAAERLRRGDSRDRVLSTLGLSDGATGSSERHSLYWDLPPVRLHVYFTHDNRVCEVSYEGEDGRTEAIVPPR